MQELYNEGRVIGLSAYEIYVRHHMEYYGDDKDNPPASERAWLASSISLGTSVLIQVSKNMGSTVNESSEDIGDVDVSPTYWLVEIPMLKKSRLCASSNIIASMFIGEGVLDNNNKPFCKSVKSYGFLSDRRGKTVYNSLKTNEEENITHYDAQLREYAKLIDGVVIQPNTNWEDGIPDLKNCPKIRLLFRSKVETTFYLLLSGFSDCSIISGTSIYQDGIIGDRRPETGDFLGPIRFPWASKIIITTPLAIISRLYSNKFARSFATDKKLGEYSGVSGGSDKPYKIVEDPILDLTHYHAPDFYDNPEPESKLANKQARLKEDIKQYSPIGDGINQLSVVSKDKGKYDLPAPYVRSVSNNGGTQYVYPLDCAAPGTIKAYPEGTSPDELNAFPDNRPGSYPLIMWDDGTMSRVDVSSGTVTVAPVADMDQYTNFSGDTDKSGKYVTIYAGSVKNVDGSYSSKYAQIPVRAFGTVQSKYSGSKSTLTKAPEASVYKLDGSDPLDMDYPTTGLELGTKAKLANFISLRNLSKIAYTDNERIDLLGHALRDFRNNLKRSNYANSLYNTSSGDPAKTDWSNGSQSSGNHETIVVNKPIQFNGHQQFQDNVQIDGHLQMKWHSTRKNGCRGAITSREVAGELHIDAISGPNSGGPLGCVNTFAIGMVGVKNPDDTLYVEDGEQGGDRRASKDNTMITDWRNNQPFKNTGVMPNAAGYITMTNGLRFYISSKEPAGEDIPIGSIGIGW